LTCCSGQLSEIRAFRTTSAKSASTRIDIRLMSAGGFCAWGFEERGRKLDVRVNGKLTCNSVVPVLPHRL